MDPAFLQEAFERVLPGLPLTLRLAATSVALGFLLAMAIVAMRGSGFLPLSLAARAFVFVFRGTPLLVQLFLIYYGLGQFAEVRQSVLWPFLRDAWWCALLALTLNTGAYGSEILRGGMAAVPAGQIEAAKAVGMSRWLTFQRIQAPIALRQALPGYGNEIILMVKATSLASTVTLMELTGLARKLGADTYRYVEALIVAGAVQWIEWRLSPHLRGAPVGRAVTVDAR
jgi:octopine/nopaline transport system permease protein